MEKHNFVLEASKIFNSDKGDEYKLYHLYELIQKTHNEGFYERFPSITELSNKLKDLGFKFKYLKKTHVFKITTHVSAGCYGSWCDVEILTPFAVWMKYVYKYNQ